MSAAPSGKIPHLKSNQYPVTGGGVKIIPPIMTCKFSVHDYCTIAPKAVVDCNGNDENKRQCPCWNQISWKMMEDLK